MRAILPALALVAALTQAAHAQTVGVSKPAENLYGQVVIRNPGGIEGLGYGVSCMAGTGEFEIIGIADEDMRGLKKDDVVAIYHAPDVGLGARPDDSKYSPKSCPNGAITFFSKEAWTDTRD